MKPTGKDTRTEILNAIKRRGHVTQAGLAEALGITREAVRQHLAAFEAEGVILKEAASSSARGRPTQIYRVSDEGEHRFPKYYGELSLILIKSLDDKFGEDGVESVLTGITDTQVEAWLPRMEGKDLAARIRELRNIYFDDDPFTSVEQDDEGAMLIEHNCPYLAVASREPRLCSLTLSTLKRLLGVEVERTERFQEGDGRCVFRIRENVAVPEDFRFGWEDPQKQDALKL